MSEGKGRGGAGGEQLLYARVLEAGTRAGCVILVTSFLLYVSGLVPAAVPIEELPRCWTLDATGYLEAVNGEFLHRDSPPTGWDWVGELDHGDFLNFAGIAVLSAVTILCYIWILPSLLRRKDWAYAAMAAAEILVLALAASGILAAGH